MLEQLYGGDGDLGDRVSTQDGTEYGTYWATKTFEKHVNSRTELNNNFCFNLFFCIVISICCCFRGCCNRMDWIRRGKVKYHQFQLALERLSKEQDIQYIIEMNRISRLLHKINFLTRQRRAVQYTHKFVITAQDVKRATAKKDKNQDSNVKKPETNSTKVLEGFDPINNEMDRLMLFEVTGMRLRNNEFQDDSSSDSENNTASEELLPIDYAFMERFSDEEDDSGQQANLTPSINP